MINNSAYAQTTIRRQYEHYGKLQLFYHIAAIGENWQDILLEQIGIVQDLKLTTPVCGFVGSNKDRIWAEKNGANIASYHPDIKQYETITLKLLYDWSHHNKQSAVLYFHTKGASNSNAEIPRHWRYLMTDYLIKDYDFNLKLLHIVDLVGVDYVHSNYPHFSGNFWMARCDWIAQLDDPWEHRKNIKFHYGGHPWSRLHAEFWVCSKPKYIAESLCCTNQVLYNGHEVFNIYKTQEGRK